jgi:hypothetical protein
VCGATEVPVAVGVAGGSRTPVVVPVPVVPVPVVPMPVMAPLVEPAPPSDSTDALDLLRVTDGFRLSVGKKAASACCTMAWDAR